MKISKAIEQLQDALKDQWCPWSQDLKDAIKLGIEALKRLDYCRSGEFNPPFEELPGEEPE